MFRVWYFKLLNLKNGKVFNYYFIMVGNFGVNFFIIVII